MQSTQSRAVDGFAFPAKRSREEEPDDGHVFSHYLTTKEQPRPTASAEKKVIVRQQNRSTPLAFPVEKWRAPSLVDCRSSMLERLQARASFASAFYPKSRRPLTSIFRSLTLPEDVVQANPARAMAVDAVCLAHMGVMTKNQSAVYEGAQLYQGALTNFRRSLTHAFAEQKFDNGLLEASQALVFCERFAFIGRGDLGRFIHIKALGHMLLSRGLDTFKTDFDRLLLEDFQHYTNRYGIMTRHSIHPLLEAAWGQEKVTSQGPFTRLSQLCAGVPALLEKCDLTCKKIEDSKGAAKAKACARSTAVIAELKKLETSFQKWLEAWYANSDDVTYHSVSPDSFEPFRLDVPHDLQAVFPLVFRFASFAGAIGHSRFFISLLLIRAAIADLLYAALPDETPLRNRTHNVTECADELSQCLVYLCCEPTNGIAGPASITCHLKIVHGWYKRIDDQKKMRWCQALTKIVESRGLWSPQLE